MVEFRGIGVNVHLPSVALKAYVGGSHGHCGVELRYVLRHLLYTMSTCRCVKARSDWFESSWSKRHTLTRADLRDSDKHCRHVRRPLTMPTQEYLVSTRFVLTFLLYLACHGRGARQPKAAEQFVASTGQVPKGVCLTTMVPTAGVERMSVELCASLADSWTSIVVDGSVEVLRALGSRSKANELVQIIKCCCESEDEGVQVTIVAMLVLGLASVVDNWFAGSDGANRGCCSVASTLAVEEMFPTRGFWHGADVFHWCDTTEASKDHHQLRTGSSRRLGLRRFCRTKLRERDGPGRCEFCRVESPCVRRF